MAKNLGLRANTYGKKNIRQLVVSNRISAHILRHKLIEGDTILKEKYELIPPSFVKVG